MATEGIKFEPPAQSRDEDILYTTLQGELYEKEAESRIEDLLIQLNESIVSGGGGGFTPTETQLMAMNSGIDSEKVQQIETNKTNISSIENSLSSTSSDNGKVLTADGSGGYSWQPASGGGTAKYLYQLTVGWGCKTISPPILGYNLRFCVSFVSDDENLAVTGSIDYNTFINKYIKFNTSTGYAWVVNANSVFISDGSSGAFADNPVSTVRINWDNEHWFFRTSDGEKELEKGIGNPTVLGTKTEI